MIEYLLGLLYYETLLVFGIYVSAAFSGIIFHRKNIIVLFGFNCVISLIQFIVFSYYGIPVSEQLYPIIGHLPIILFLIFYYKKEILTSVISVAGAYLCCQLGKWISVILMVFISNKCAFYVMNVIVLIIIAYLIVQYVAKAVNAILSQSR